MSETRLLGFVGDLLVDREDPDSAFALARDALAVPDLLSGNCECAYAADAENPPGVTVPVTADPGNLAAFANAGFDLLTLANNHAVDGGHRGLFEMQGHLDDLGIAHVGTGRDLADARRPVMTEVDGQTIATLSYSCFFPRGYEALDDWPGLAPMRAHNYYRDLLPNVWAPGTPPVCATVPVAEDVEHLAEDLASASAAADVVVAQFHWGDYKRPFVLSDHETRTARFAVDHGADIVIGHHHHILRGIEWYRDAPIFYGLGHFVFDLSSFRGPKEIVANATLRDPETDDSYDLAPREGWPLLPWHRDARMTALAWVELEGASVTAAGFLPCMLNREGQVYPVDADSEEGRQVCDYVRRGSELESLGIELTGEGAAHFGDLGSVRVVASR